MQPRTGFILPLFFKDLAGLDIHCAAAATMYPHLADNAAPSPTLAGLALTAAMLVLAAGQGFAQEKDPPQRKRLTATGRSRRVELTQ